MDNAVLSQGQAQILWQALRFQKARADVVTGATEKEKDKGKEKETALAKEHRKGKRQTKDS